MSDKGYARPELLVDVEWLKARLNDPQVKAVDTRPAARYASGHIKGAVNLLVARLDDPANPVRSMPIPPDRFGAYLGNLGIGNDDHVVIYDEQGLLASSRLFWMMDYYGHQKLSMLEGGYPQWVASGGETTTEPATPTPKEYQARPEPDKIALKSDVHARLGSKDTLFLDVRSPAEFKGQMVQAMKGGHIPGAVNVEWSQALAAGDAPVFRTGPELQELFQKAGVSKEREVITYCQGGVRAAHTYFVLKLLGYDKVRNYTGSWGEWGNDPTAPVET